MSKISNMSMNELFEKTGIACNSTEFQVICNYNEEAIANFIATETAIEEIEGEINSQESLNIGDNEKLRAMRNKRVKNSIWQELFIRFEDVIDKERLVLFSLANKQKVIQDKTLDKETEKSVRKDISDMIRMIGKDQFRVVFLEKETYDSDIERVNALNSQELVRAVKANKKFQV